MEYIYDYLSFLAQAITIVVALLVILSALTALGARRHQVGTGHLEINKLNDRLDGLKERIDEVVLPPQAFKKARKQATKAAKKEAKQASKQVASDEPPGKRVFVLSFEGDLQASKVVQLRHEINAILMHAAKTDEIVVRVESPGGMVHGYGLAASQLHRIRERGLHLVVAVDKVAASGGYLMAAVANKVIAAPFALVGSIGVVAQIPNVHRLLKKNDIDFEVITAGQYKRTMTVFGENTEEGRQKFTEELEDVHALFQEFVHDNRPSVDLAKVATGEAWYGQRAIDLNLVDEIATSDAYLMQQCEDADVFEIRWVEQKKPLERVLGQIENGINQLTQLFQGRGSL
ncbi:MAG: protease SohB [Pseudomonadales bacterium]